MFLSSYHLANDSKIQILEKKIQTGTAELVWFKLSSKTSSYLEYKEAIHKLGEFGQCSENESDKISSFFIVAA